MTDLPADPRAWTDGADVAPAAVPVPPPAADEPSVGPAAGGDAVARAAAYEDAPAATGWRAYVGPFVGVALVGIGLGFLLARTAGSSVVAASGRTVLTSPTRPVPTTAAVLGAAATRAPATTTAATTATAPVVTAPVAATTTASPTTAATAVAPPSTEPPAPSAEAAPAPPAIEAPVRWAEFSGGVVYLHGRIPNAEVGATIARKAAAVVGPGNVAQDYVIDPTAPAVAGGPLTVADTVQFDADSAVVRPEFGQILGLGALLLRQNPAASITVVGRADSRGPASYNLRLSNARASAVAAYLVGAGADPDRVAIDARGAGDPLADGDTAADRQANRSVEFVIDGLLE